MIAILGFDILKSHRMRVSKSNRGTHLVLEMS